MSAAAAAAAPAAAPPEGEVDPWKMHQIPRETRIIINLLGTSGSGKGTQGEKLRDKYGLAHISIGDIFRDHLRANSDFGKLVVYHDTINPNYVPDELPLGLMALRLGQKDCVRGFILDGFPRTGGQADATIRTFLRPGDIHIPVFMDVPEEAIRDRITRRLICVDCGTQVRAHDRKPGDSEPQVCPEEGCEGKLENRVEDVDAAKLDRRFRLFKEHRDDILRVLGERDAITTLELRPDEDPDAVFDKVDAIVAGQLRVWNRTPKRR